jgi:hypothetical protein
MSSVPPAPAFIVRLVLSYVAGTVVAPLLWALWGLAAAAGRAESASILSLTSGIAIVAWLSFIFSFKYFLLALALALLFRRSISNHLLIWSAASVAGVPVLWLTEAYLKEGRGQDLLPFLKSMGGSAAVVCCYAFVYAAIFYVWNWVSRRGAENEPGSKT